MVNQNFKEDTLSLDFFLINKQVLNKKFAFAKQK